MYNNIKLILNFFSVYYKKYKNKLIFYSSALLFHRLFSLLIPLSLKYLIDTAINMKTGGIRELNYYGLLYLGVVICFIIFLVSRNYFSEVITINVETDLKKRGIEKIAKSDYSAIIEKDTSYFIQRIMNDIEMSSDLMFYDFSLFLANLLYLIGLIVIMAYISPLLTSLLFVIVPIFWITTKYYIPKIRLISEKIRKNEEDITQILEEAKTGVAAIKLFRLYDYLDRKLKTVIKKSLYFRKRNMKYQLEYDYIIVAGLMNLSAIVIFWVGGIFVFRQILSVGSLVALNLYFSKIWTPTEFFMDFPKTISIKLVSFFRVKELFDLKDEDYSVEGKQELSEFNSLEIQNMSFAYNGNEVLKNINLTVNKGEKILIQGDNGSGKTTLLKVIIRLVKRDSGKVLVNGYDTQSYTLDSIRKNIVFISQSPFLFKGHIKKYISQKDPVISFNHKDNMNEKTVFERGNNLSGGEKKIIQLMRGLEINGDVYLLDEPLENIDKENRQAFIEQIQVLFKDKTLIIVSHQDDFNGVVDKVYNVEGSTLVRK